MHIKLGVGVFGSADGIALNAFEALPIGDLATDSDGEILLGGATELNSCEFEIASFGGRAST